MVLPVSSLNNVMLWGLTFSSEGVGPKFLHRQSPRNCELLFWRYKIQNSPHFKDKHFMTPPVNRPVRSLWLCPSQSIASCTCHSYNKIKKCSAGKKLTKHNIFPMIIYNNFVTPPSHCYEFHDPPPPIFHVKNDDPVYSGPFLKKMPSPYEKLIYPNF